MTTNYENSVIELNIPVTTYEATALKVLTDQTQFFIKLMDDMFFHMSVQQNQIKSFQDHIWEIL